MPASPERQIARIAGIVFFLDQFTKLVVLKNLGYAQEKILLPGFFKFVHVGNTGAAWSMFRGNNAILAVVALAALVALFMARRHFGAGTLAGQVALGLVFGGIAGNFLDRVLPTRNHVIDFIYFFLNRADGSERWSFPAFNIADSAICIGVGLILLLNWKKETPGQPVNPDASAH
jgi:signal peptidase II